MSSIREIIASGTWFGIQLIPESVERMTVVGSAPGGFFVFGMVMALANKIAESKGKPKAVLHGCENCPMAKHCSIKDAHEGCEKKEAEA